MVLVMVCEGVSKEARRGHALKTVTLPPHCSYQSLHSFFFLRLYLRQCFGHSIECKLTPATRSPSLLLYLVTLWPWLLMDYPCGKFGDCSYINPPLHDLYRLYILSWLRQCQACTYTLLYPPLPIAFYTYIRHCLTCTYPLDPPLSSLYTYTPLDPPLPNLCTVSWWVCSWQQHNLPNDYTGPVLAHIA